MRSSSVTSEQMEALLLLLGYQRRPSKGPQRVFENREYDAVQLLPPEGREPYARIEHLMTLRRVSIEKGIIDEQGFEALLDQVSQEHVEKAVSHSAA